MTPGWHNMGSRRKVYNTKEWSLGFPIICRMTGPKKFWNFFSICKLTNYTSSFASNFLLSVISLMRKNIWKYTTLKAKSERYFWQNELIYSCHVCYRYFQCCTASPPATKNFNCLFIYFFFTINKNSTRFWAYIWKLHHSILHRFLIINI